VAAVPVLAIVISIVPSLLAMFGICCSANSMRNMDLLAASKIMSGVVVSMLFIGVSDNTTTTTALTRE